MIHVDAISVGVCLTFAVILLGIARSSRSNLLSKVSPLAGETVLFEDTQAAYTHLGQQRAVYNSMVFMNATVRVTNKRLLIAQKALFSRQLCLMFVIYHEPGAMPESERTPFPYVSFEVTGQPGEGPGCLQVVNQTNVRLFPREQAAYLPAYLEIRSPRLPDYLARLLKNPN